MAEPASDNYRLPASARAFRKRISRGNLHDEVVEVLRDMIIQDELSPGMRIPEAELCALLGISRTPLREAIRVLASEGLVTPLPRRGVVVATPTPEEIRGLLLSLGAIESVCAPLACENFTAEEIRKIRQQHERMMRHHARGQKREYYETNQTIHEAVIGGARNSFLSDLHRSLSLRILRVRYFIDLPKTAWARALGEHEQILECIEKRNGKKLASLLLEHFEGTWRDFERTLQAQEPVTDPSTIPGAN